MRAIRTTTISILALGLLASSAVGVAAQETLTVEVTETGNRFALDPSLADADGNPTRGATFVTEGYIYESGTLTCTDGACDGVVYDEAGMPSPEFPDAVLGTWTCYGIFTEDATVTTGSFVATTQHFDLGDGAGEDIIVTTGQEYIDLGLTISRVVVGGTGAYQSAHGVQAQTFIGVNNADLMIDGIPYFGMTWTTDLPIE